jgi:hypothetical protein
MIKKNKGEAPEYRTIKGARTVGKSPPLAKDLPKPSKAEPREKK